MEQEQKLNKQIKFGEENKKMKNLTNQDFKDIENEVKRDLILKTKSILKMTKLLQKRRNKDISIIKNVSLFK